MFPSAVGDRSEAAVLAALVAAGKEVLVPFGQYRFDLAYEEHGKLVKIQCKTGVVRKGVIVFPTCWSGRGPRRDYRDQVDFFGVYCHERGEVYMVPIGDLPLRLGSLRVSAPRNSQQKNIRWAAPYLISPRAPSSDDAAQLKLVT